LGEREKKKQQALLHHVKPIFDLESWKSAHNAIIINLSYNYKRTFSATGFKTEPEEEKNMQKRCCPSDNNSEL
jgi:hypothetical protein